MTTTSKEAIMSGLWDSARWELFASEQLPDPAACTAIGCVAIVDLEQQVVAMTRNTRSKDSWEMPAGHIEPGETIMDALVRESYEEAGFKVSRAQLFAYRKIYRLDSTDISKLSERQQNYPAVSYLPYFYAFTTSDRTAFSGEEIFETADFSVPILETMVAAGKVHLEELAIIKLGLQAAQNKH